MEARLTRSHQAEGLLWRLWPFIYLLILAGLAGIITLDILGYRYASRFVWLRSLESFSVLLLWRLLMALLLVRLFHHLVDFMVRLSFRSHRGTSPSASPFDQVFRIVYMIGNTLLAIVAAGVILEIWGVSVSWFLTSPLGGDILRRAAVIALTIALMILVMKISKAVTEYLVQPRTTPQGIINQPNRKFRTMVPLIHTLLKFGIVFGAMIVVLQQLNVAIGPILTGVGIFGLAVGFASQSLIKDVINGLFILFEDSLSVGDIVILRGIGGEVEKVTLRAVTIRDLNGHVHVIPNSTLDLITNMTKVFSRQVIDVGIAYREDIDSVIGILNELIAVACLKVKVILALSAEIRARITLGTFPPARKCVSNSLDEILSPAFVAVIKESTTTRGGTFLMRMKTSSNSPTFTPEKTAVIQRLTGTKYRNTKNSTIPPKTNMSNESASVGIAIRLEVLQLFGVIQFL
jgi:small-conductance mechanosensitive channel